MLIVIICPNCAHLSLVCGELGTVFANLADTVLVRCGNFTLEPLGGNCPECGSTDLDDFRDATLQELESAGFERSQFVDVGVADIN
jgi:hypothetical protein